MNKYEHKIDDVIKKVAGLKPKRLRLDTHEGEMGYSWLITPTNAKAAKISIYGVDSGTLHLSLADHYDREVFLEPQDWNGNMRMLEEYIEAVMNGKFTGWRGKEQAVIEVQVGDRKQTYIQNVLWPGIFKRMPGVSRDQYESY